MDAERNLASLLRLAYSGELAAAIAYAGHWRAVSDPQERGRIREIEAEEWAHRRRVGEMLAALGARPSRLRELRMALTGTVIAALCFLGGWYIPMYGAGRIERTNIIEYEEATRLAWLAGHPAWAYELLAMAEVEWDHERYFHDKVRSHRLHRVLRGWPDPPPRSMIRSTFASIRSGEQAVGTLEARRRAA
jgi:hypothetical protein